MLQTSSSHRVHVAFYGRCNSGKSSLINALTGQEVAIVSSVAGTTTDPVAKPIELPGVGATILIDTPGLDDNTSLGEQRKAQTLKTINKTDVAVVLFSDTDTSVEEALITQLKAREIPVIGIVSKCDTLQNDVSLLSAIARISGSQPISLSATTKEGIDKLLSRLATLSQQEQRLITEGLCNSGDMVILVMPQDAQAPKGRLIKPQVEVIRELLDRGCNTLCTTPEGLQASLNSLNTPPQLIITDSQAFAPVLKIVEEYRKTLASSSPQSQTPSRLRRTPPKFFFAKFRGKVASLKQGSNAQSSEDTNSPSVFAENRGSTLKGGGGKSQENLPLLTSFSILFARYKGDIDTFIEGAKKLQTLSPNSRVLIAEACSHIPQNEDIGRVKLPRMLRNCIGEDLQIDIVGGNDFPNDLSQYDLVIHCGACMFNRRHVMSRVAQAKTQNVAITNYGIAILYLVRGAECEITTNVNPCKLETPNIMTKETE